MKKQKDFATVSDIVEKGLSDRQEIVTLENKINRLTARLEKKNRDSFCWPQMVRALAEKLKERISADSTEVLGPFGLENEMIIYLITKETRLSIRLRPHYRSDDSQENVFYCEPCYVDQNKSSEHYAKGTIGELNGLNYSSYSLPDSFDNVIAIMKRGETK